MPRQYRNKFVDGFEVEAAKLGPHNAMELARWTGGISRMLVAGPPVPVRTRRWGWMDAKDGAWIVQFDDGTWDVYQESAFLGSFEPVEAATP